LTSGGQVSLTTATRRERRAGMKSSTTIASPSFIGMAGMVACARNSSMTGRRSVVPTSCCHGDFTTALHHAGTRRRRRAFDAPSRKEPL